MKIHYVALSTIPSRTANSIQIMKMCKAFSNGENLVTCIIPKYNRNEYRNMDPFKFYGINQNFQIYRIPWIGIKIYTLIYSILAIFYSLRNKVDLIYTRNILIAFISVLLGIETIFESHFPFESISNKNISKLYIYLFKFISLKRKLRKIVVISTYLKRYFHHKFGIPYTEILVAHDCADIINSEVKKIKFDEEKFHVGYVGHLYKGRGIELIISLAKRMKWVEFHVVGGNEIEINYWQKQTKKIENIIFHGFFPNYKIKNYLISFDVLIAPYQNYVGVADGNFNSIKWTSPLKIFEYMSSRQPIIISNLYPFNRIFQNNENAILCECNEAEDWYNAITDLKNDIELRLRLAENAYHLFLEKFTWEKRAKIILESFT